MWSKWETEFEFIELGLAWGKIDGVELALWLRQVDRIRTWRTAGWNWEVDRTWWSWWAHLRRGELLRLDWNWHRNVKVRKWEAFVSCWIRLLFQGLCFSWKDLFEEKLALFLCRILSDTSKVLVKTWHWPMHESLWNLRMHLRAVHVRHRIRVIWMSPNYGRATQRSRHTRWRLASRWLSSYFL